MDSSSSSDEQKQRFKDLRGRIPRETTVIEAEAGKPEEALHSTVTHRKLNYLLEALQGDALESAKQYEASASTYSLAPSISS
ncbi:unnamed protein product [Heligmosomoides polygyrus]|uniref:Actin-related protein 2/3 complex subunit 5 n=1 Tax=Heligmosomoides polygyrus TaxID=6339 RepID=A0A183F4I8_HELPZ|nr:unnamed protein product [Heligmosomoides polygyrus]